jgi:subtilisin family serine protease
MANTGERALLVIPSTLVDLILLGPADDRRELQDSPVLGDVWLAYANAPGSRQDLLITPHKIATAGGVAREISQQLSRVGDQPESNAQIAYLQGLVAARLSLREMLRVLVPLTAWWSERKIQKTLARDYSPAAVLQRLDDLFSSLLGVPGTNHPRNDSFSSLDRYLALAGLLLWAGAPVVPPRWNRPDPPSPEAILQLALANSRVIQEALVSLYTQISSDEAGEPAKGLIFQVSLNRAVSPALERSIPAVKADAARGLFNVRTHKIVWAVLDSGIDRDHKAFADKDGTSRVIRTFDFTRVRQFLSSDSDRLSPEQLATLLRGVDMTPEEAGQRLAHLRQDAAAQRPIDWDVVEELLTLHTPPPPSSAHGTHVAGIIGAMKPEPEASYGDGMCPDIRLYDFRVLARTVEDTEFAVIAALQYIRYVNERHSYITIHGANLSLSIPHNVRNYACGRTPVCNECQRLIESGVVVVAAAGNRGYQKFETKEGLFESYAAFSITDPGNAEDVITVGATHGNWPHTYGVSFFSSRGPTGDGRSKPDLVAPGERIEAPIPNNESGAESGTSMAAPHVSGAAAMLMARYPELIGNPRRIKRILCDSATDLGRERSFQGHGMLDVLRAFQSI